MAPNTISRRRDAARPCGASRFHHRGSGRGPRAEWPLQLGVLTPLTGAGGFDGPRMLKAMQAVATEVNAVGGLLGRQISLIVEDDQTNPEAAVRAARKLIDVSKVPVIMGTWASAVTSAVAPVCWESKTFLTTVSGADFDHAAAAPGLPDPHAAEQSPAGGQACRVHVLARAPSACSACRSRRRSRMPTQKRLAEVLPQGGSELVGALIYEKDKTTYRSEIDQALRTKPDFLYLNGYAPDVTVLLRDLYRAGFEGGRMTQSYALTSKVMESLPPEVTEGAYTTQPSADIESPAFALRRQAASASTTRTPTRPRRPTGSASSA